MLQHYKKKKSADSSLAGVTAPVTPCSLASAASSPATGAELNRPHPSAVPAPVLTETKWRQVPRGTSWEATALWGRETKETEDDRRGRGTPPPLFFVPPSTHCIFTWMRPPQPVPRPAPERAEDFTSTPPIQATQHHTVRPSPTHSNRTAPDSLRMFVQPAVIGCCLMMNGCRLLSLSCHLWFTVGTVVS